MEDLITKAILGAGPAASIVAAVLWFLFKDERSERRELQKVLDTRLAAAIEADNRVSAALDNLTRTVLAKQP